MTLDSEASPGVFQFRESEIRVSESASPVVIVIENIGNTTQSAILRVSTAGGTATTNQDYVGLSNQQVTFTSGDGVKEVSTPIIDDDEVEGNESFVVHLELQDPSNPSATLGPKSNVTIIIVDNDQPPGPGVFQFRVSEIGVSESASPVVIVIENIGNTAQSAILRVSTAGGTATTNQDFVGLSNQQVTFTSGDGVKEVSTPIIDDDEVEGNESFVVHLELQDPSNPSATLGPKSNVTIIIVDNDHPPGPGVFQFRVSEIGVSESASPVVIVIENIGNTAQSAILRVSTAGGTATTDQDYVGLSNQQVTFTSGDGVKEVSTPIIDDDEVEGNESFVVHLELQDPSNPSATLGPKSNVTIIIVDNDQPPGPGVFQFRVSEVRVSESASPVVIVIENIGNTAQSATLRVSTADGTATAGQDYIGISNQQVNFTSGDGVKEVSTPIIDDDEVEGNETFVVHLELQDPSNPSATLGPKSNVTIIIVDNDQSPGKCEILHLLFFYRFIYRIIT
ncbi:hypothetical protein OS493_031078 [Desmophyllum pertusum]|uniref:Calx-beta domain-containing protein n=1 Tax=Desmophyllum pertusum TaxID=174260 RepID=A0A9W9YMK9_9CNID|nr:hypothetical protein OS493_031078 [Desmophyllum pertusum]